MRKEILKRLYKYLEKYKISLIFVFVSSIISTVFFVIAPVVTGEITTTLYNGIKNDFFDWKKINLLLIVLLLLYLISEIFTFIQNYLIANISSRVIKNIREDVDNKIHKLDISFYDKNQNGEILSVITNDIDSMNKMLGNHITQLITQIVTAIGIFVIMLKVSFSLTIISIVILVLSFVSFSFVMKKSGKYFAKQQDDLARINGFIEEAYNGHLIIQAFNHEEKAINDFDKENKKLYEVLKKSEILSSITNPVIMFLNNLGYIATAFFGVIMILQGKITIGNVQAMLQYSKQFSQPFSTIAGLTASISSFFAGAKRVFDLIDLDEEISEKNTNVSLDDVRGNITFKNVNFGYTKEKQIMKNVNLEVKEGEKIAIVGPTGAGKTTLINLLMKFYDINSGEIFLDGININEISKKELRKNFGMVLQDTWLFEGTIMENLSYGQSLVDEEKIIKASKMLGADNFIRALPNGYNMKLTHGAENISQGERQLLTIVRAIVSNPKIMILDEATSNVDTRTEFVIQQAMKELIKGRTSFVIAHRLSTIKDADKILYIEDGTIKEQGSHQELIKLNGKYKALYDSQFA